ncbi:MAG: imelysin family protein [Aureispira sp.]
MKNVTQILVTFMATALLWTACQKVDDTDPNANLKEKVVENYATIVHASYEASHQTAVALQTAIHTLVDQPSAANLLAAKTAWKAAREPYGQTEAYRFYDGPIDDENGPEGALNAWPLDENYIDYTTDASGVITNTGIIADATTYPTINATVLAGLNEQGGEKNISIGYHAIEFLLWGQDYMDVNINAGQGGDRPYTDFTSTASDYQRRGEYIKACAQLLVDDLETLVTAWAEGGAYRSSFMALSADDALSKILTGAGVLSKSELAGERIFVALEANASDNPQEDEHSCFSDNTNRDVITNAQGITNILKGTFVRPNGITAGNTEEGILALLTKVDATASAELTAANTDAMFKVASIPNPFDKTVTEESIGDNGPVLQAVTALQKQGDEIAEAATALGLTISTELPD